MDKLRKLFKGKNKNINTNLAVIAAVGIILLIMSGTFLDNKESIPFIEDELTQISVETARETKSTYEKSLESRLEEAFRNVEGVGEVKVMLTLSHGKEIVVAEDIATSESRTSETDSTGGTREVTSQSIDSNKIIITNPGGVNEPLIIKEMEPQVEGVIIIAEGGNNIFVVEALINATRAVLGIEPHKIQVLQMVSKDN